MIDEERPGKSEPPSKTKRKEQMHALQALGERLVALNPEQLAEIGLPESLHDAVEAARRMTRREARRRQVQFIGRLMRDVDPEPIQQKLAVWDGVSHEHVARQHQIERWRERLIADEDALADLLREHPGADSQRLRMAIRNARSERDGDRPPRGYRELFRLLRELLE